MKKMKRALLLVLSFAMVFSGLIIPSTAVDNASAGQTPFNVYDSVGYSQEAAADARLDASSYPQVKSITAKPSGSYQIKEAADITALASLVNTSGYDFAGVTLYLTADINMSAVANQQPIGVRVGEATSSSTFQKTNEKYFSGTIDGQGYKIYGLNLSATLAEHQSLAFIGMAKAATVRNLYLQGSVTHSIGTHTYNNYAGTAALIANGETGAASTIHNVYCDVEVKANDIRHAAGFIARGSANISLSTNAGDINGTTDAGGFACFAGAIKLENSLNIGAIRSSGKAAGFVTRARHTTTILNCVNDGAVVGSSHAGGIVGVAEAGAAMLTNCTNYGLVYATMANAMGSKGDGTLTTTLCTDATRSGYDADAYVYVDLSSIADINTITGTPAAAAYKITDAAGMVKLSALVKAGNTFSGKTIYLANDVDLSGSTFEPIGYYYQSDASTSTTQSFKGSFDGQGHTISGLMLEYAKDTISGIGLFGHASGGTIRSVVLAPSCSFARGAGGSYGATGALVGVASGVNVFNVLTEASINGVGHAAGIIGRGSATIQYCTNKGKIYGGNCAGGLTAYQVIGEKKYCTNYGAISGGIVGGLVGRSGNDISLHLKLINYGVVLGDTHAGGIVGRILSNAIKLTDCTNYGSVGAYRVDTAQTEPLYTVWTENGHTDQAVVTNCEDLSVTGCSSELVIPRALPALDMKDYDLIPNADAYRITDADGLIKLASVVNGGKTLEGVTVYLANDINMNGKTMLPIGYGSYAFAGTFDGQGHTIRALRMRYDSSDATQPADIALFGYASSAIIQNLTLDATCSFVQTGKDAAEAGAVAAVVAKASGVTRVFNVKTQATVVGLLHSASIIGRGSATAQNCVNSGSVTGANSAGGIVGFECLDVLSCVNYGDVKAVSAEGSASAYGKAGGVIACQHTEGAFYINCFNYGLVSADYYAGGVIGTVCANCWISDCVNYGAVAPLVGLDTFTSTRYNVESGCVPAVTGRGVADLSNIGYSAEIAEADKVDLDALLDAGLALNIEDYNHDTHAATIHYLIIDSPSDLRRCAQIINNTTRGNVSGVQKVFYLACDIDMSGYTFTGDRTMAEANTIAPIGWDKITDDGVPTGSSSVAAGTVKEMFFAGIFDGQGHTISGLKMAATEKGDSYLGLFGYLKGATVRNLILDKGCTFSTTYSDYNFKLGGLAGGGQDSVIRNVWVQANVEGVGGQVGGFGGRLSNMTFINCTNGGNITGGGDVGGFGGFCSDMKLYNCRNTGIITGTTYAAGFTARDHGVGLYVNCANIGTVTGTTYAGAIVAGKDEASVTQYSSCINNGTVNKNGTSTGALIDRVVDGAAFKQLKKSNSNHKADDYHLNQMLSVKYQTKSNGDGTFALRLLSSVDSLNYKSAGFVLQIEGVGTGKQTLPVQYVYTSVLSSEGGSVLTHTASQHFADTSKYFLVATIPNVPDEHFSKLGTSACMMKAYVVTEGDGGERLGYRPIEEISASKLTATVTTSIGTIKRFSTAQKYEIGETGVTIDLQYQAWPSVCVDENGTIYAFISGRLEHVDPFGHHLMYKSTDGGNTWDGPVRINDTPMDDRDIGVTYMGDGRMLVTYFRIAANEFLTTAQSFKTADGETITGKRSTALTSDGKKYADGYVQWQNMVTQKQFDAVIEYWSTKNADELTGGNWVLISNDYGNSWSVPIKASNTAPHGAIQLRDGSLFYVGRASVPGVGGDGIYAFSSTDGGYNWTFVSKLHENTVLTYCEPHVVELSNGRLLAAYRIQPQNVSIDGVTYTSKGFDKTGNVIYVDSQNVEYVISEDRVVTKRTHSGEYTGFRIYTVYSDDGGKTWSDPKMVVATDTTGLTATAGQVYGTPPHLIQLDNGAVVLTYANRSAPSGAAKIGERAIISYDGGMTWDKEIVLCEKTIGSSWFSNPTTDLGYPATAVLKDGSLITVYYQGDGNTDDYCSFLYTKWTLK